MKRLFSTFLALSLLATTAIASGGDEEGRLKVNTKTSTLNWKGSKITGSSHGGTIAIKGGTVEMQKGMVANARVTVDMNSIAVTDDMGADMQDKLIGHLQSPDFFNTVEHGESHFVLKAFKKDERAGYVVSGTLTIKGISNDISFPARAAVNEDKVIIDAKFSFDRAKYDVRYGSGSFFDNLGDNMINDDVEMVLHLEATK